MNYKLPILPVIIFLCIIQHLNAWAAPVIAGNKLQKKLQSSSLAFIENKGQITDQHYQPRKDIQFKLNAPGIDIFIGDGQIHYQWSKVNDSMAQLRNGSIGQFDNSAIRVEDSKLTGAGENEPIINQTSYITYRMDVVLLNANTNAKIITEDAQDYYENYYLPQCPDGATAHSFKKITYKNIYPDIDWVIYIGGQSQILNQKSYMKYDFIIHPGGNPKDIQIQYNGATSLKLKDGALTATTPFGSITENIPYTYEANTKKEISSKFMLKDNILSFDIAQYNGALVIDPQLEWATYYGGSDREMAWGNGIIATDKLGYIYFCGATSSINRIATTGSFQDTIRGNNDAFLVKFSGAGVRQWATYYGGNTINPSGPGGGGFHDGFLAISIQNDDIYIAGAMASSGMATANAHQNYLDTFTLLPQYPCDGFIAKFKTNGLRVWSTYYGDASYDLVSSIEVEGDHFYVAGMTSGYGVAMPNAFASPGAWQINNRGKYDNFLAKFDTSGKRIWGTYYGGGDFEWSYSAIAIDKQGYVYMGGVTNSTDHIATPGSHLDKNDSSNTTSYIVKFDVDGNRVWATYYGDHTVISTVLSSSVSSMAVDADNNLLIAGGSLSNTGIATVGSYKETKDFGNDAFLAKFDPFGHRLWGTYFGGAGVEEFFWGIAIDKNEDICLVGRTTSKDGIATTGGWKTNVLDTNNGMFVKFDKNGNRLWSTFYGSSSYDALTGITVDDSNNVYMAGVTSSDTGIANSPSHQATYGGDYDAFLIKVLPDSIVYIEPVDSVLCINSTGGHVRIGYIATRSFHTANVFTVQLSDSNGSFASPVIIGAKAATYSGYIDCVIPVNTVRAKGYRIRVLASAPYYASLDNGIDIELKDGPEKPIAIGDTLLCTGQTLYLTATCASPGVSFIWSGPNNFTASTANTQRQNMTLADAGLYVVTVSPPECKTRDTVSTKVFRSPAKPTITHNAPICEGDTLSFSFRQDIDSNTFYTVGWPNPNAILGQNSLVDSATLDFTGQYIVVANNNNCIATDTSFIFIKPLPVLKPTSNSPLYAGQDLKLSASSDSTAYQWEGPDGFISSLHNPVVPNVTSYNSGIYTVTGIRNGCTAKADVIVQVNELDDDFFVLFPNPNDGRFTIKGNLRSDQTIQMLVVNDIGQEIYTDKVKTTKKTINHSVTLPPVANGVYMLHLRVNGKAKAIPFVVGK